MNTFLPPDTDLLTFPFCATTDFTDLADYCERFAATLMECEENTQKMALLGRLGACLALLRPQLSEAVPEHLMARLMAAELPEPQANFEPDAEALCDYCQNLTQLLCEQSLRPETENSLKGLLCELVWMFAADLRAPRWVQAPLPH